MLTGVSTLYQGYFILNGSGLGYPGHHLLSDCVDLFQWHRFDSFIIRCFGRKQRGKSWLDNEFSPFFIPLCKGGTAKGNTTIEKEDSQLAFTTAPDKLSLALKPEITRLLPLDWNSNVHVYIKSRSRLQWRQKRAALLVLQIYWTSLYFCSNTSENLNHVLIFWDLLMNFCLAPFIVPAINYGILDHHVDTALGTDIWDAGRLCWS